MFLDIIYRKIYVFVSLINFLLKLFLSFCLLNLLSNFYCLHNTKKLILYNFFHYICII